MPFEINIKKYIKAARIRNFHETYQYLNNVGYFRDVITDTKNQDSKSILIFGCSFGYGHLLKKEQSFSYKLSKLAKRNVYNRSIPSLGVQYFPYIMKNFDIEKTVTNPEYIIFVFIDNHIYRLYRYFYEDVEAFKDIRYKSVNNKLTQINDRNNIFQYFSIIRYLQNVFGKIKYESKSFDENFDFMKQHFLYAKEIATEKFPKAKLVILKYQETQNSEIYLSKRWKELQKEGFIVIDSYSLTGKDLCDREFRLKDNIHPNEKAWDILTPKIIEKLYEKT